MALDMKKFFANTSKEELQRLWKQVKDEEIAAKDSINATEFLEFIDSFHKEVIKIPISFFAEDQNLAPKYSGSFFLCNLVIWNSTKKLSFL